MDERNALVAEHILGLRRVTGADVPQKHYNLGWDEAQMAWIDADGEQVYCRWCGNMPDFFGDVAAAGIGEDRLLAEGWAIEVFQFDGVYRVIYTHLDLPDEQFAGASRIRAEASMIAALATKGVSVSALHPANPNPGLPEPR